MQQLLPQIRQFAADRTREAASALNALGRVVKVLQVLDSEYQETYQTLTVRVDSGKYEGQVLPVVQIQLDGKGVTIWATHNENPKKFRVTGELEVTQA